MGAKARTPARGRSRTRQRRDLSPAGATSGDRRRHVRYGVVGRLWGSLEVIEALPIEDLSNLGARVASGRSLQLDTTHAGRLVLAGQVFDLRVRVRHTDAGAVPHGARCRYQLGLEFMGLSPTAAAEVQQLLDY